MLNSDGAQVNLSELSIYCHQQLGKVVGYPMLQQLAKSGSIPAVKAGKSWNVRETDLNEVLDAVQRRLAR